MAAVKLPDTVSWEMLLGKTLSVTVSEWYIILAVCKIWGRDILDSRESRKSSAALSSVASTHHISINQHWSLLEENQFFSLADFSNSELRKLKSKIKLN